MTERAEVLSVAPDGSTMVVRCAMVETCSSCSTILCNPRARTYTAARSTLLAGEPQAGDSVEVELPQAGATAKGLLLFGLPIALFVGVYVAVGGSATETVRAVAGMAGLLFGLGLATLAGRLLPEPMPTVTAIYRSPGLVPWEPTASTAGS